MDSLVMFRTVEALLTDRTPRPANTCAWPYCTDTPERLGFCSSHFVKVTDMAVAGGEEDTER